MDTAYRRRVRAREGQIRHTCDTASSCRRDHAPARSARASKPRRSASSSSSAPTSSAIVRSCAGRRRRRRLHPAGRNLRRGPRRGSAPGARRAGSSVRATRRRAVPHHRARSRPGAPRRARRAPPRGRSGSRWHGAVRGPPRRPRSPRSVTGRESSRERVSPAAATVNDHLDLGQLRRDEPRQRLPRSFQVAEPEQRLGASLGGDRDARSDLLERDRVRLVRERQRPFAVAGPRHDAGELGSGFDGGVCEPPCSPSSRDRSIEESGADPPEVELDPVDGDERVGGAPAIVDLLGDREARRASSIAVACSPRRSRIRLEAVRFSRASGRSRAPPRSRAPRTAAPRRSGSRLCSCRRA